ncbi:MAG: alpha/beta hydrolase fold domain-containing protein [Acidimicrobiales bacterium]
MSAGAVHPDLRRIAPFLPRSAVGPRRLPILRRADARQRRRQRPGIDIIEVGPIGLRVHRPDGRLGCLPGLLWIHGGGYVMGTATQDDAVCQHLANEVGVVVAAVDYRLAPEHPFPIPLHDCYNALAWLADQPEVDRDRIAIGGASAGGGLAAALALLARQRGEIQPIFQLLSYPMLDDRTVARPDRDDHHVRLWNHRSNRFGWTAYLDQAPGGPGVDHLAAAARCTDLVGLPPAWIGVGTLDLFLDEDLAYAAALRAAGVPCEVETVEGAFHGFDSVRPGATITETFRASQARALRSSLGCAGPDGLASRSGGGQGEA